jgi:uncharacterized protein YuzE
MHAKYFNDTDTLLINFSDHQVADTYDLNENVLVEVDDKGNVVSMTFEHAKQQTDVTNFSYQLSSV